ncbi:CD59 glycoprotein-like [Mobula hypostoma]|uniref:CD59 glycoprotein-like n=1 Tax=Mobula hypostoma TaxID=723540 RepID=UPI002FC2E306
MEHSFLKFLLVFSLCSAFGSALQCYVCETEEDSLCKTQSCITGQNACLNVTFHTQQFFRRCWYTSKCDIKDVQSEFNIESGLSLSCCSWDLCNSKSGVAPAAPALSSLGLLSTFASLHLFCLRS